MININPPLPVLGRDDVLKMSKENDKMSKLAIRNDTFFYKALLEKLQELIQVNAKNYDLMFGASIKKNMQAVFNQNKEMFKDKYSLSGILRNTINPESGGLVDAAITGLEQKREEKKKEKVARKDFEEAFMRTDAGRKLNIRPDNVRKAEIDKEFKQFMEIQKAEANKRKEIERQQEQADKFGGIGGPTKKSLAELEKLQKLQQLNLDRIMGKKKEPAQKLGKADDGAMTAAEKETASESNSIFKSMLTSLQSIEAAVLESVSLSGKPSAPTTPEEPKSKGIFGSLFDMISNFLVGGIKSLLTMLFNPRNLMKVITKIALPAMIIGSLVNGIMDGFKAFKETGSIKEAIISGLGGIVEFLSFGFFDKESIRESFEAVSKAFDGLVGLFEEYIVAPVMDYIVNPITNFFKGVYDSIVNTLAKIKIPEVAFTIPVINKKVSIGPFEPFAKNNDKPVAEPPSVLPNVKPSPNIKAQTITEKSIETELSKKTKPSAESTTVAPTIISNANSSTKINMSRSVRNQESSFNRYLTR